MILTMENIYRMATYVTKMYMQKGYILSPTMKDLQGELLKIDLSKDNEVIRVSILKDTIKNICYIYVERFINVNKNATLWNGKGEFLTRINYYSLDRYNRIYTRDKKEYEIASEKRSNRWRNIQYETFISDIKITNQLLNIIHQQSGYKSVRKSQIKNAKSFIDENGKYYMIDIEGKKFLYFRLTKNK